MSHNKTFLPVVIKPDGKIEFVNPYNNKDFKLEQAQLLVGGYVQLVKIINGILLCDEDGLAKGLAYNEKASALTGHVHRIVGNALVCPAHMFE